MIRTLLLLLALPFLLGSCAPSVSTMLTSPRAPLHYGEDVRVFGLYDPVPKQAEVIGTVRIGDSGFTTNCSWEVVVERARTEARKAGGNALKIIDHQKPNMASTCHRITANILRTTGTEPEFEPVPEPVPGKPAVADRDAYFNPGKTSEPGIESTPDMTYNTTYPKVKVSINGGWSTRIARVSEDVPPDFREYIKELKQGYHLGADASYYFAEQMGFGLKYSTYKASNSAEISGQSQNGSMMRGTMSDQIAISFFGPTFNTRQLDRSSKNSFHFGAGLGYIGYRNNSKVLNENYKITSSTLGLSWDVGYDINLSKDTALGLQLSLMTGILSKLKVQNGFSTNTITLEKENMENLTRIDLSVGLRFIK